MIPDLQRSSELVKAYHIQRHQENQNQHEIPGGHNHTPINWSKDTLLAGVIQATVAIPSREQGHPVLLPEPLFGGRSVQKVG